MSFKLAPGTNEALSAVLRADDATSMDLIALCRAAGRDPGTHFEDNDWIGVDFRSSDLRGVSFRGARLLGATVYRDQAELISATAPESVDNLVILDRPQESSGRDRGSTLTSGDGIVADSDEPSAEAWGKALAILKQEIGKAAHERWIEPLQFLETTADEVRLSAPSDFAADWVNRHYAPEIVSALNEAGLRRARVAIGFSGASVGQAEPISPRDMLLSSPLDSRFTFDNFIVNRSNELAYAAARRIAEDDSVVYNPVFLHGGVGLGKTHLMHAIAWRIAERFPARKVLYLSAEQFMYRFIQAIRRDSTFDFREQFRSVDVLMISHVQFIAGKNSTQEEFFHTFNALIDAGKQIVISGDRAPGEIDGLEERIRSRLQWGLVVDIHPTDYELRLGILQSKAEVALEKDPSIRFDPKVLEFLAHRISSNVRVLEGALTRLFAFATLVGREITLDMAQECLADLLRASDRKVTIDEIMRKVAEHYNLRLSDMKSARRARAVARPRQIAMYLAKTLTSKSLPEIGRHFGGRDHTVVMHAVKRVESLTDTDRKLAEDVELLRRKLEA